MDNLEEKRSKLERLEVIRVDQQNIETNGQKLQNVWCSVIVNVCSNWELVMLIIKKVL